MTNTIPRVTRKTISLTREDVRDLQLSRSAPAALLRVSSSTVRGQSEAAIIRAVFEIGLERVRSESDAAGYAELALDPEQVEFDTAMRARARRGLAD